MPELDIRITILDFPEDASAEFFTEIVDTLVEEALHHHINEGYVADVECEIY